MGWVLKYPAPRNRVLLGVRSCAGPVARERQTEMHPESLGLRDRHDYGKDKPVSDVGQVVSHGSESGRTTNTVPLPSSGSMKASETRRCILAPRAVLSWGRR
jgi:hypothetical protein